MTEIHFRKILTDLFLQRAGCFSSFLRQSFRRFLKLPFSPFQLIFQCFLLFLCSLQYGQLTGQLLTGGKDILDGSSVFRL